MSHRPPSSFLHPHSSLSNFLIPPSSFLSLHSLRIRPLSSFLLPPPSLLLLDIRPRRHILKRWLGGKEHRRPASPGPAKESGAFPERREEGRRRSQLGPPVCPPPTSRLMFCGSSGARRWRAMQHNRERRRPRTKQREPGQSPRPREKLRTQARRGFRLLQHAVSRGQGSSRAMPSPGNKPGSPALSP